MDASDWLTVVLVFITGLSVIAAERMRMDAKRAGRIAEESARSAADSAQAARESNRIAEQALETYRDEIEFARRVKISAYFRHAYASLVRDPNRPTPFMSTIKTAPASGFVAVTVVQNLGRAIHL